MYLEHLSCVEDVLPPAKSSLREKMEKALSLLEDSLGSRCFQVQTFLLGYVIMDFQNGLQMYVITDRVNAYTYQMPSLVEYYIFARVCNHGFPEWTSNVRYYRPSECLYLSDAISCGVGGTIALPPVFESDQPKYCCAVLELVTMEQKQDFDLETEKVFQALQAADLRINLQPRLRPECFSRDQRAELTEIANVTRAVCQTHRLPLALTWIPCDYTRGTVDDISKLRVRLRDSRMIRKCVFFIERTSCYGDEEMQDILALRKTCKSLRMFSKEELLGERGSKVSKNNDKIKPAPDPDGARKGFLIHICRSKEGISGSSLVSLNVRSDSLVKEMSKYLVGPFTVMSKLTSPEDLKLIQYVFDSSLNVRSEFFLRVLVCLAERF
ncbi:hypothetical protein H0E87_028858 [Populus deltoides]|uniref:NLP1-9 GAF domain-containing protein n=1 Tax=Populus deltoides TaxID=3696 RepID=A0A8T2WUY1_POPDE|nr:hypothetical protein H0E87_028858 [Populus deltoides]